jgi:hypothetical protein
MEIKFSFIFIGLLIGSLFLVSSCTSNDASSVSSEESGPLAQNNDSDVGNLSSDLNDIENLEQELDTLDDLDLGDLEF